PRECWEAFASELAALARYRALARQRSRGVDFSRLVDEALEGDDAAREALLETAHYLGVGISNVVKALSPTAVIVGGIIARAWPVISDKLRIAVDTNSVCRGLPSARIVASTLGENPRIMGAVSLVLASKFASAITS